MHDAKHLKFEIPKPKNIETVCKESFTHKLINNRTSDIY